MNRRLLVALGLLTACGGTDSPTEPPVTDPPVLVATAITLSASSVSLSSLGETSQLTATVKDQNGATMTGQTVTWSSTDAAVAAVSAAGFVTAVSTGSATITATSGSVSATASAAIAQVAASILLSADTLRFTSLNDTIRMVTTVEDAGGSEMVASLAWLSSDTLTATVDSAGLVRAVGNGTTTILASAEGVAAEAYAKVEQVSATVLLSDSVLSFTSLGDTLRLSANVQDSAGVTIDGVEIQWSSSDTTVATVVNTGLVTAVAN